MCNPSNLLPKPTMKNLEKTRKKVIIWRCHKMGTNNAVTAKKHRTVPHHKKRPPRKDLESKPFAICVVLKTVIKKAK